MKLDSPPLLDKVARPVVNRWISTMGFSLVLALGFAPVQATAKSEPKRPITVTIVVFKVDENGKKNGRLPPGEQPKAGEVLIYRASYRNESKENLPAVIVMVPLPPGMVYVADSAVPAASHASKDNSQYFPIAAAPTNAPLSTWRSIRWAPRDLGPLSELVVELKARMSTPSGE